MIDFALWVAGALVAGLVLTSCVLYAYEMIRLRHWGMFWMLLAFIALVLLERRLPTIIE